MITSIEIKDNAKSPLYYLPDIFKNNSEFVFKEGINIIIGPNGSDKLFLKQNGKKLLIKLLI